MTNDKVQFIIGDEKVPMRVGECWYGDFNVPHSVCNFGEMERIHLTIDCQRNKWSDSLFRESGYDFYIENMVIEYNDKTKRSMIEMLRQMNNEASELLIKQLEKELGI